MSNLKEEFPDEDYLDEDKPFKHQVKKQNYCVISMLTPNSFPENKRGEFMDQKILGIKVRGIFEEYQDASDRASKLQKVDKYHNIFVGEVGKWLPFDVDTTNMGSEDQVYREKSLNKYMKSYKDCLHEEKVEETNRKNNMLHGANVVTGRHGAPDITELGKLDNEVKVGHGETKNSLNNENNELERNNNENNELDKNNNEKKVLENELENSKANLELLEEKLATINKIYSELKTKN